MFIIKWHTRLSHKTDVNCLNSECSLVMSLCMTLVVTASYYKGPFTFDVRQRHHAGWWRAAGACFERIMAFSHAFGADYGALDWELVWRNQAIGSCRYGQLIVAFQTKGNSIQIHRVWTQVKFAVCHKSQSDNGTVNKKIVTNFDRFWNEEYFWEQFDVKERIALFILLVFFQENKQEQQSTKMLSSMVKDHQAKQSARKEEQGGFCEDEIELTELNELFVVLLIRAKTKGSCGCLAGIDSSAGWSFECRVCLRSFDRRFIRF